MGLFENREKIASGKTRVPLWFMRQAGRYHNHYQNIKKDSDFMSMCKTPELACEVTMGPIDEFKFDAAILFSDLLFPLEQMGMGLTYNPGPILSFKIDEMNDLKKLNIKENAKSFYKFQADALTLLKDKLPKEKTLLGFTGAPWTLYAYAAEGSHAGNLISSKKGLYDGRFHGFMEILLPQLEENLKIQAEGGADALCLFDTAVGELDRSHFNTFVVPYLKKITANLKKAYPDKKIIYYSKHTNLSYLRDIEDENIDVLGIDWRLNLNQALKTLGKDYYIQGNLDPSLLHLPWEILETKWLDLWNSLDSDVPFDKWILGLGHGVLPKTPERNVKNSVEFIHQNFLY